MTPGQATEGISAWLKVGIFYSLRLTLIIALVPTPWLVHKMIFAYQIFPYPSGHEWHYVPAIAFGTILDGLVGIFIFFKLAASCWITPMEAEQSTWSNVLFWEAFKLILEQTQLLFLLALPGILYFGWSCYCISFPNWVCALFILHGDIATGLFLIGIVAASNEPRGL